MHGVWTACGQIHNPQVALWMTCGYPCLQPLWHPICAGQSAIFHRPNPEYPLWIIFPNSYNRSSIWRVSGGPHPPLYPRNYKFFTSAGRVIHKNPRPLARCVRGAIHRPSETITRPSPTPHHEARSTPVHARLRPPPRSRPPTRHQPIPHGASPKHQRPRPPSPSPRYTKPPAGSLPPGVKGVAVVYVCVPAFIAAAPLLFAACTPAKTR